MNKPLLVITLLSTILSFGIKASAQNFQDFKAEIYAGPFKNPVWMVVKPEGDIRDQEGNPAARPSVNFAGRYFVYFHHCGHDCLYMTITDLSTGMDLDVSKRFDYSNPALFKAIDGQITSSVVLIEPESKLLIIQIKYLPPDDRLHNRCMEQSFTLIGTGLKALRSAKPCKDRSLETYGYSVGPELPKFTPDWAEFFPNIAGCSKAVYPLQTNGLNFLSQRADYRADMPLKTTGAANPQVVLESQQQASDTNGQCGSIEFGAASRLTSKPTKAQIRDAKSWGRSAKFLESLTGFPGPRQEKTNITVHGLPAVLTVGYSNDDTIYMSNYKWVTLEVTIASGKSLRLSGFSDELQIKAVAEAIDFRGLSHEMDEYSSKFRNAMGEN